jgi:hypothetical protein
MLGSNPPPFYGTDPRAFRNESIVACTKPGTIRFPDLRQKRERKGPTATCKGSTSATPSMADVWGVIG